MVFLPCVCDGEPMGRAPTTSRRVALWRWGRRRVRPPKFSKKELLIYRKALEETSAIAITDQYGRFTYVNESFCALSGFSKEELLGKTPKMLNSGYHSKEFYQDLWKTITSGSIWHGEIRNRHKSGRVYWSATTIMPFGDGKRYPHRYISIRNDISEIKNAKEEHKRLISTQTRLNEAEKAVLTRDQFLSMTAHELQTPLTSLQLKLEMQLKKATLCAAGLSKDEQLKAFSFALGRARKLSSMVSDLLDATKIISGVIALRPERMNLPRVIDEVLNQYHDDFEKEGISVSYSAPESLWGVWDKMRIEQVVINLLTNALKYGDKKPISVRVEERSGGRVVISVHDQGRGMSKEFAKKVFDKFSREKEGGVPGSGLGLWITDKIVRAHGGKVLIDSEVGMGSTFSVVLPTQQCESGKIFL